MNINPSAGIRLTVFVAFFVAIGHHLQAQNKNVLGAMVGTSVSHLSNYDGKTVMGITGGLYWEGKLADSYSLQSYFLYSQRGERADDVSPDLRLQYINLPIMIKYYITEDFQVMAGVYWDLLLGVDGSHYSKSDFKNSDFGIPVGLSYDLSNRFQIGLSYSMGLTNISNSDSDNLAPKNNWGSLTIAYLFR